MEPTFEGFRIADEMHRGLRNESSKKLSVRQREIAASIFERDAVGESAASLGRSGQKVERTLQALKAFDGPPEARVAVLKAATDAVYSYFIQREICGFGNHEESIALYDIPDEVLKRLGIV